MSYRDVEELWEQLEELPFQCSMEALRAVVLNEASALYLPPPNEFVPFTGERTQDVLLFLCSDADGILGMVRAPAERIDRQMRKDLQTMHCKVFANAADLTEEMWDAAIRIMSALSMEMRDVGEMVRWAQDEGSSLTEEQLEPLWDLWQGCDVRDWEQLQTCPSAVCALRRAM